jgi:dihydroflavonol-4-reductase
MTLVLLTGASGYIAKHIALQLLNSGYEVRASVRSLGRSAEIVAALTPHLTEVANLDARLTFVELDLLNDEGWSTALSGVDALLHTASPFPLVQPKNEDELIRPAVDGTRRAMKSAHDAGVKRVVLTSSIAAIYGGQPAGVELNEELWTDVSKPGVDAYTKSKTLAEQAAWELAREYNLDLTTINPSVVVGAPLDKHFGSSISIVERLLNRKDPVLPQLTFAYVDVKDVALMHVAALENASTIEQRYLATAESLSFHDVVCVLQSAFQSRKFVTRVAPNFLIKFVGLFDKAVRTTFPFLGKPMITSNSKAEQAFNLQFRSARESIIESAKFLIENDLVKK